jgi:dienelactone hydrolase
VRRRLIPVAIVILLFGGISYLTVPYLRALSLIVRGAHLGGTAETMATKAAYKVTRPPIHTVPTRYGVVPAQFYLPERSIADPVLVIPGIHSSGIEEPRLTSLSNELAATGLPVMTLAVPDLQAYRITPQATDVIEDAALWLASRTDLAHRGRIGIVGISFAGGMSVSAATRPSLRDRLAYVVSFGGHGNLRRVMKFLATGEQTRVAGVASHPPHDYGVAVILYGLADRGIVPAEQVNPLREGLRTFLLGSQQTVWAKEASVKTFARAREYAATLPEPSRTYMTWVNNRAVKPLGQALVPYLDQLGADDPSLSPDRTPTVPDAPVYLLHGMDDTVIPATESALLAEHLRHKGADVHLLLSGLVSHAEVNSDVPVSEVLKLVSFWASVLRQ